MLTSDGERSHFYCKINCDTIKTQRRHKPESLWYHFFMILIATNQMFIEILKLSLKKMRGNATQIYDQEA